jgi:hypothetical protein
VVGMQQRQREWRQHGRAEAAVAAAFGGAASAAGQAPSLPGSGAAAAGGSTGQGISRQPSRLRQVAGSAAGTSPSHLIGSPGPSSAVSLSLLHCLRPDARAALLLSLPAQQRHQLLAVMSDAERAGLVVLLDESTRLQVLAASAKCTAYPIIG